MQDLSHLHDKKFAIIMIEDDGSEEGDWVVISGFAKWRNGHLFLHREMDIPEFPVPDEALDRINLVSADVRDILEGAAYSITLSVGPIPDGIDPATLIHTGFKWPDKTE
jgi:hypothetical protein